MALTEDEVITVKFKPQPVVSDYRKQSSTDLQSRLKSRKVLGVGVTEDGLDIHRSKLSQLLGTSDDLVNIGKLPFGLSIWLQVIAATSLLLTLWCVILPNSYGSYVYKELSSHYYIHSALMICLFVQFLGCSSSTDIQTIRHNLICAEIYLLAHTAGSLLTFVSNFTLILVVLLLTNALFFLSTLSTFNKFTHHIKSLMKREEDNNVPLRGRETPPLEQVSESDSISFKKDI